MVDKEIIKRIKSDFFALRNGEIADRLRKAGSPYKIIFGLQIPQLEQIAAKLEPSAELAAALWDNTSTRESRLLATMVYPKSDFNLDMAKKWSDESDTVELIDMLCFRLVRYVDGAMSLVDDKYKSSSGKERYFAFRLAMNLLVLGRIENLDCLYSMAKAEYAKNVPSTKSIAFQIIEEIDFLKEK